VADSTSKCNFGNWSKKMSCGRINSVTETSKSKEH